MNYDFKKAMRKIEKALFAIKHWILASCRDGNVSARTISIVVINGEIYFQTDKNTLKYHQIKNNNRVALCSGNCNIEGTAIDRRHPSDKKTRY